MKEFSRSALLIFAVVFFTGLLPSGCKTTPLYMDESLSFEERTNDLVARMTLEEKVSQLSYTSAAIPRLNIPEYNWWNECLHGVGRAGLATVFPQAIGMAAMWDDSLMFDIATIVSDEARAKHHHFLQQDKRNIYKGLTFWTPNINIFRDPRWGRGMETYGEDPYLTGQLGVAYIKGLQGNDEKYLKLVATAKHFAVHSGPEESRHRFNAQPSGYDFLETYTPQFEMAVKEGHAYSVMCAYNSLDGQPCCGNERLSNLLRNDWGFTGYIVSDCWAIRDFYAQDAHEIVNTKAEAAGIALRAGTDLNCGDTYPALLEAVEKGYITEAEIDTATKRLMLARFKLGMFDAPQHVPFASIPLSVVDSEKHQKAALTAAEKSMVLLKNDKQTLPLSKALKKIAVLGPNAHDTEALLGNYNGYPSAPVTPFAGIKAKLPTAQVHYAPGCRLANELPLLTAVPADVLFADEQATKNGLSAGYFANGNWSGSPIHTENVATIDNKWWDKAPLNELSADTFSIRYTGYFKAPASGVFAIGAEGYPVLSLTFNEQKLIDYNTEHHPQKQYEHLTLEAGKVYPIELCYAQAKTEYALARLLWEAPNDQLEKEALDLAANADAIVLCMGLSPLLEGEEMKVKVDGFAHGDRNHIELPQSQKDFIKAAMALKKPTVLVLLNGSALTFEWEAKHVPAIIEAWYPGQAGGSALANILFGDTNPSGRLPVTFYKSTDQLPPFDSYDMAGRTYRYFEGEPLYPFGYGLSYTTFTCSNVLLPDSLVAGSNLPISTTVTNTGKYAGEEVVQLYVSHPGQPMAKAVRTLKAFKRVYLQPGESKEVSFILSPKDMALLRDDLRYVIAPGPLQIAVGGRQPGTTNDTSVTIGSVQLETMDNEHYLVN